MTLYVSVKSVPCHPVPCHQDLAQGQVCDVMTCHCHSAKGYQDQIECQQLRGKQMFSETVCFSENTKSNINKDRSCGIFQIP